jgi:hypothetical protein
MNKEVSWTTHKVYVTRKLVTVAAYYPQDNSIFSREKYGGLSVFAVGDLTVIYRGAGGGDAILSYVDEKRSVLPGGIQAFPM